MFQWGHTRKFALKWRYFILNQLQPISAGWVGSIPLWLPITYMYICMYVCKHNGTLLIYIYQRVTSLFNGVKNMHTKIFIQTQPCAQLMLMEDKHKFIHMYTYACMYIFRELCTCTYTHTHIYLQIDMH